LKKLLWRKYLFVGRTEAETEQAYWNGKRKKHLASEHTEGIVNGLGVTQTDPPSLSIQIAGGRAVDTNGNDPEVESVQEIDLSSLVPPSGAQTVFLVLSFIETEVEPYFVDETGEYQNKYVQDGALVEVLTAPPMDPKLELARIQLVAGATEIRNAADPANPHANEIDLRYRKYSGQILLDLKDLNDVSEDQANAFHNMDSPSAANPIATIQDVVDAVDPVESEVIAARGSKASLDARLDGAVAEDGALKPHKTSHQSGGSDELDVTGLSGMLADPQVPVLHATVHEAGGPDEISVEGLPGQLASPQTPALHGESHTFSEEDAIYVGGLFGELAEPQKIAVAKNTAVMAERPQLNFRDAFEVGDDWPYERANISLAVKPHYAAQLGDVYGGAVAVAVDLSADGWIDMKGVRLPNTGSPIAKIEVATAGGVLPPYGQKYGSMRLRFAFYPETAPVGNEAVRFWVSAESRGGSLISIFSTSWARYNYYLDKNIGIYGVQYALVLADIELPSWPPGQPLIWTLGLGRDAGHANDTYPGSVVVLRPVLFWWDNSSEYL